MRESLHQYSDGKMGVPDDDLVRRVLDAGGGAPATQIHAFLRHLRLERRQEVGNGGPQNWGWFPVVAAQTFRQQVEQVAATEKSG